ncbi:uncharacterized protein LOC116611352 [Nematostella vectensis]|uniref:uncharacterized protein LOC116611352 n=1 Tax=Nematostella vectensis TaxID=45351 RepID=UPI001390076A|nr:uncharacterized protein LOC116611352 [Nematostella vectensis]
MTTLSSSTVFHKEPAGLLSFAEEFNIITIVAVSFLSRGPPSIECRGRKQLEKKNGKLDDRGINTTRLVKKTSSNANKEEHNKLLFIQESTKRCGVLWSSSVCWCRAVFYSPLELPAPHALVVATRGRRA